MPEFPTDFRMLIMMTGLGISLIGAIGFMVWRAILGNRMTRTNHPDLYIEGVGEMKIRDKKLHYSRVTRKAALEGEGKYWFWSAIGGFAIIWMAALFPVVQTLLGFGNS